MLISIPTSQVAVTAKTSMMRLTTPTRHYLSIAILLFMFACERRATESFSESSNDVRPNADSGRSRENAALEIGLAYAIEHGYVRDRARIAVHSRRYDVTDRYWSFEIGPVEPSPGLQAWLRVHDDGRVEWLQ